PDGRGFVTPGWLHSGVPDTMPLPMSRSRLLLPVSLVFSMSLLAACGSDGGAGNTQGERTVPVTTALVQPQPFNDTQQAIGTASAHESVVVTAKVSETVQEVHFDSGDVVAKGAALVTLSG